MKVVKVSPPGRAPRNLAEKSARLDDAETTPFFLRIELSFDEQQLIAGTLDPTIVQDRLEKWFAPRFQALQEYVELLGSARTP